MDKRKQFCSEFSKNIGKKKDLSKYEKLQLNNLCMTVMEISEDNKTALSFKDNIKFNKKMNPIFKNVIDMEF